MLEGFNEMDTLTDRCLKSDLRHSIFSAKKLCLRSGFLAIVSTTLDSLTGLLSGFQTPNPFRYPIGKRRMQPLGYEFYLTKENAKWSVDVTLSVTMAKAVLLSLKLIDEYSTMK
ncbi:hypothetical protein U9M48_044231 [Paspalum notatum var. saurae]|uniref:Uncharacterized protein n=1 Tax=Paspalum notatum var. saurae TaxID=547442 RepID=A0AAQ3UWD7_PASNO